MRSFCILWLFPCYTDIFYITREFWQRMVFLQAALYLVAGSINLKVNITCQKLEKSFKVTECSNM